MKPGNLQKRGAKSNSVQNSRLRDKRGPGALFYREESFFLLEG